MDNNLRYRYALLHLSLIDGVGPATIHKKIIERVSSSFALDSIYSLSVHDWMQFGISLTLAQHIYKELQNTELLDRELALVEKAAVSLLTILDDIYPDRLRAIYLPPPVLYYKGTVPYQNRQLAFVGSRQANHYGKHVIESLIPDLVAHDFGIVSGGALGADSMAHQATLQAGGKTVVVLGSGLLKLYPYQNKKLFEKTIESGGAIVSTFAMNASPLPGNFAARNRVIAGLCNGVVVVQAAQKSGTRITAQFALEQGRDVFAVPGSIDDPLSAGCHSLIKEGAKLVTKSFDILEEYGITPFQTQEYGLKSFIIRQNQQNSPGVSRSIEEHILAICSQPQAIDEIALKTEKSLQEVQVILFEMQIAGILEQDFTGLWKTL